MSRKEDINELKESANLLWNKLVRLDDKIKVLENEINWIKNAVLVEPPWKNKKYTCNGSLLHFENGGVIFTANDIEEVK